MTGEVISSLGKVLINGKNIATQMNEVRHLIGYCPQFDALLDNLSSREHLELYAAIKGIPPNIREPLIQQLLQEMNLSKFENVNAGTYSGGNRRKLSVAIALIGNPPIILLDEPSSGMDPEARRFMWSVIGKLTNEKKQSTVVLTTHSMEEAEALSTKLAIMVEGNFKCIGPVQSIKDKYGKGFEVEVKLNVPSDEDLRHRASYDAANKMDGMLEEAQIKEFFDYLKNPILYDEVRPNGSASHIYKQMQSNKYVGIKVVLEYVYMQEKGNMVWQFLTHFFGKVELLENFQSFFRFKIVEDATLSRMFGE